MLIGAARLQFVDQWIIGSAQFLADRLISYRYLQNWSPENRRPKPEDQTKTNAKIAKWVIKGQIPLNIIIA